MVRTLFCLALLFISLSAQSSLEFSISSAPARINPLLATDSASADVAGYIFNGLVKFDKNGTIVGDLAESFVFENNTTLLFTLRKGVKWHDGELFDADDILYTYKLLNSPKMVTPYKDDFRYIKSIEKPDAHHIRVTYTQPYFKALSIWMMGILPEHLWRGVEDPMTSELNKFPVGTGPFKMTKPFKINERIVLERHEGYFVHPPNIEKINLHYIADPSTLFMTLKSKKLDAGSLDPLQMERQIGSEFKKEFRLIEQPSQSYTYMGFNLRKKIFQNSSVREAIAYAINKKELIDLLFFSHGTICEGPFMPGSDAYPPDFLPTPYDPERSKAILRDLGYDAAHPLRFELATNTGNDTRMYAAQIIQHQLGKAGIEITIRAMEWQAFLNTVVLPHQFDAVLLGWNLSLIPDANSIWHSDGDTKGGFNFVGYHNDEVDRLIVESEKIVDEKQFAKNYQKIFTLIARDYPYIFLFIPNSITAISKEIGGIEPSIIGIEYNLIDWNKTGSGGKE